MAFNRLGQKNSTATLTARDGATGVSEVELFRTVYLTEVV